MEAVFHVEGGVDGYDSDSRSVEWCDLREEKDMEWEENLGLKLEEVSELGMTKDGRKRLEQLLRKNLAVVRLRLNGGSPVKVPPLELRLLPDTTPERAKPRHYTPEKRDFMRRYVTDQKRLGLVKPADRTEWVSAPLIVRKKPPAMYRLKIDYRKVNAATQKKTLPMPHIDVVLAVFRGARAFAAIDF